MRQSDKQRFAEIMIETGERYGQTVSTERMRLYFEDLIEFSLADVERAIRMHVRDSVRGRFFPMVADVIGHIEGSVSDRAAEAWSQAVRLGSNWRAAKTDDAAMQAAVTSMGGWQRIGNADERELGFMAKDFAQLYAIHSRRQTMQQLDAANILSLVKKP